MMQRLVSKAQFSRLAGVTKGAIQKAVTKQLAPAYQKNRIDLAHPAAIAYLQAQAPTPQQPGAAVIGSAQAPAVVGSAQSPNVDAAQSVDEFYNRAVEIFTAAGYSSIALLKRELEIGDRRAGKIIKQLRENGITFKSQRSGGGSFNGGEAARENKKRSAVVVDAVPEYLEEFLGYTLRDLISKFGTDYRFVDWLKAVQIIEAIQEKRIRNAEKTGELINRQLVKVGIIEPVDSALSKLLSDGSRTIATRATAMHDAGRSLDEIEKFVSDTVGSYIKPMKAKMKRAIEHASA